MTDQLARDLAAVFHDRATATEVPPAPIDRLVREGQRVAATRRRRNGVLAAVAAAAALVAVALPVGLHSGHHSAPTPVAPTHSPSAPSGPTTLAGLPQGAPPSVPYLQNGALHVDGAAIPTKATTVVSAGGTVLVGRWYDATITWSVLRDGALHFVPMMKNVDPHAISPDGEFAIAESWPDKQHTVLDPIDLATRKTIGSSLSLNEAYASCCGGGQEVQILGVDAHGTAYFSDRRGVAVWWPGVFRPVELGSLSAMAATPGGLVIQNDDSTGRLVTADRDGRLRTVAHLPTNQGFTMSDDGSLLAYDMPEQGSDKLGLEATPGRVVDLSTGRSTDLVLPTDTGEATPVAFEGDASVLVSVRAPGTGPATRRHEVILRCAVDSGACERAVDLGTGDHRDAVAGWRY